MLSRRFNTRRLSAAVAAFALAAASVFLSAAPASAHDELQSTDPAAGATLDAAPEEVTLTFSGNLLDGEGATEVQVTDASGTTLSVGAAVVEANVVTQQLSGEGSGAVEVLWKVVSSDGHPISGEFAFTVTPATTPTPTATPTETPEPTPTETATPTPTAEPLPGPPMSAADVLPWIIGGVVLAVIAAVVYLLVSRARRKRALEEAEATPAPGSEPPSDR